MRLSLNMRAAPDPRLLVPIAAWMRFIVRQAKSGVAIVDPIRAARRIGKACTGEAARISSVFRLRAGVLRPRARRRSFVAHSKPPTKSRTPQSALPLSCPHEH